jgi:hypothetical protein
VPNGEQNAITVDIVGDIVILGGVACAPEDAQKPWTSRPISPAVGT